MGQHDKALNQAKEALRRNSKSATNYDNLASAYLNLNRFEEARATLGQAEAKKIDSAVFRLNLYQLAFLQKDETKTLQQTAWAVGNGNQDLEVLLSYGADTAAFSGQLGKAREFSHGAVASAKQAGNKEAAASYEAKAAIREALFGNPSEARKQAASALALSTGRDVRSGVAIALAFAGGSALLLADDLAKQFPEDTVVHFNYLPAIQAQLHLNHNHVSKAIEGLKAASPFELGNVQFALYPVYVRGNAFLSASEGNQAAAEFQKILEWRGIVFSEPIGALAHLQIGRAYVLAGDKDKARVAYKDFLTLWKDADLDIPILKEAKAEYTKLQ